MPHVYQQLPQEHSFSGFAAPVPTYGAPEASPSPDTLAPANPEGLIAMEMPVQEDSYNAAYQHSTSQSHQSGYDNGPRETQVHKHIYVHVPPKDFENEDAVQPRVTHQAGPKQKHYKIVFIKAPSAPAMRAPIVPPAPQNEEKTLIYVLHKKPEAQPDIVIPTSAPSKPSKPEVYFIKYKTKKEEAPVYGPPPANMEIEARSAVEPTAEYDSGMPMDQSQYEMVTTTQQPSYEDEQSQVQPQPQSQQQFIQQDPSNEANVYSAPTMSAYASEETLPTAPASAEPLNQYLPPETTAAPIVVEEMPAEQPRAPAMTYGHPARYFLKRRK